VLAAARSRKPRAALLVNYTEFNTRLAGHLHAAGVRVLWYGAPQIWAWRPRRAASLRRCIDRLAVMLPFEEDLWRKEGVDARYVGHPSLEVTALDRETARHALGMTPRAAAVAILPGSRPHEVRRLLVPMLDAYERVRADRASVDGRVIVAASLNDPTRRWVQALCAARRVPAFEADAHVGAVGILRAFDVSLCASGTASLEAALAGAAPVVAYRVGLMTELAARAFVRVPHVALPNILLQRRAFPELLQRDVNPRKLAVALAEALDQRVNLLAASEELRALFGVARTPSLEVAGMLAPWLDASTRAA
jgi:lipid-A-disaccharide synthase